jgi:hypothetical protein
MEFSRDSGSDGLSVVATRFGRERRLEGSTLKDHLDLRLLEGAGCQRDVSEIPGKRRREDQREVLEEVRVVSYVHFEDRR